MTYHTFVKKSLKQQDFFLKFCFFFFSTPDIPFFSFPQPNEACEKTIAREIDPGINKPPFPSH